MRSNEELTKVRKEANGQLTEVGTHELGLRSDSTAVLSVP